MCVCVQKVSAMWSSLSSGPEVWGVREKRDRRVYNVIIMVQRVSEKRDDRQFEGVNIVAGGGDVGLKSREPMDFSSSFVFWACGGISCNNGPTNCWRQKCCRC